MRVRGHETAGHDTRSQPFAGHGVVTSEVQHPANDALRNTNIFGMEGRSAVCPGSGCPPRSHAAQIGGPGPDVGCLGVCWFRCVSKLSVNVCGSYWPVWPARKISTNCEQRI